MTTQEIKKTLAQAFPDAVKIRVRQHPMTYKGSMRGYTDITLQGKYDYFAARDKALEVLGHPAKTFVTIHNF
jgi:hypothetical protein